MSEPTDTFTFRNETSPAPQGANKSRADRHSFITPFIVLSFLALPSLVIIAATKQTAGYDLLVFMGYYQFVQAIFWLLVPLATVCGALYLFRSRSKFGRLGVLLVMVMLLVAFAYVMWPHE